MKIYKKEYVHNRGGKLRILLSTNKKEIELLKGIVEQAYLHFPKNVESLREYHDRLLNIKKALSTGLKEIKDVYPENE